MCRERDGEFARALMDQLERDLNREPHTRLWATLVLWMSDEVQSNASKLELPDDTKRRMQRMAADARRTVRRERQTADVA